MNLIKSHSNPLKKFGLIAALLAGATGSHAQELAVTPAKAGGVYGVGEKIVWHIKATGEGAQNVGKVSYALKRGALTEIGKGELTLGAEGADLETSLDAPGSILAEFKAAVPEKPMIKALAGAVVAPDKIAPSAPRPADFDAFWNAKIAELQTVPANPVLEASESGNSKVEYWKISMDNIRGSKIQGQLARPKDAKGKLPALLVVQWAGVYPLQKNWVTNRAAEGWLTLNINAHDLPIDNPADWYKEKMSGDLKDYPALGNDDCEQSYFLRMILSCYRAADYLASRDDWDGKTLVVMGSSQGGMQALMTGGLQPKVTAVIANIPAGCDHSGPLVGRRAGWPQWWDKVTGKDADKVREASRYYDAVNFASHIKVPSLVAGGLIDMTCPIAGVAAAFNQIGVPKELIVMENAEHQDKNRSQAAFYQRSNAWLASLKAGDSPLKNAGAAILTDSLAPANASKTPDSLPAFPATGVVPIGTAQSQTAPVSFLQNGDFANGTQNWNLTAAPRLQAEAIDATAGPFTRALHLTIAPGEGDKVYSVALRQKLAAPVLSGTKLTLKFWARSPQSVPLTTVIEASTPPYASITRGNMALTPEWREWRLSGTTKEDLAAQGAHVGFHLGAGTGVIEIAGVRLEAAPSP